MENIKGLKRTRLCTELSVNDVGKEVVLMGWVQRRRDLGALIFVTLRDRSGILSSFANTSSSPVGMFLLIASGLLKARVPLTAITYSLLS